MFTRQSSVVSTALPAHNANVSGTIVDFTGGGKPVDGELEIVALAVPALVDAKNITYTIQESVATGSGWAAAPWFGSMGQLGAGGVGAAAKSQRVRPPSTAKRYVRVNAAVENGGGDNTAVQFRLRVMV